MLESSITYSSIFFPNPQVIYGIDDRSDVYESSDSLMKDLSHSVAAQILDSSFQDIDVKGNLTLLKKTLADEGMCSTERFVNQNANAHCSGFLVSNDLIVTAGHCVIDDASCKNHRWVFDYANYDHEMDNFTFSPEQTYRCVELISREKNQTTGLDYSVVRLDRKVVGRKPFNFRKTGKIDNDAVLTVLGFPSGIPLKITTGALIRDNSIREYFKINSDTYGGNSGSPVVDTRTGQVEGILVRGDTDFQKSPTEDCYISVVRDQNAGRGEDATRITEVRMTKKLK